MKTRRIVSLLLAVLMIVTALPLTAMIAFAADEPAAQAAASEGTPGEKPSVLPNGKTYAGAPLHNYDAAAKWRGTTGGNGAWYGDVGTGVAAMMQDGAEGIMFKIDTSNTTAAGDTLGMTFALELGFTRKSDGETSSTYVCATPQLAKTFTSANQLTADDVSTWYYSQDGATWQTSSATGTDSTYYLSIPVGKQVTYVYVPMDAFWMRHGEAFFETGTDDASHEALNWQDAKEMIESYYVKSIRYMFSNATNALVKDTDTTITDWQIVDHVQAVSDMTTNSLLSKAIAVNSWNNYTYFVSNAATLAEPAKGVMFEVDSSAVTGDNLAFYVILSANNAGPSLTNPYMCSSWAQSDAYSGETGDDGTKPSDTSSVFYWSDDGVNWTAVASSATRPSIPKTSDKTYVYIPFESFWSRKSATYLSSGATSSTSLVDAKTQMELLGDGWSFRHVYVNTDTNTSKATFTNWSLVYDPVDVSDEAPYKMPDGSYYSTKSAFVNGKAFSAGTVNNNKVFLDAVNNSSFVVDGLNNAEGMMFKVDASRAAAGTDKLSLWFAWEITGNNGRSTYLISNHGAVDVYSDAKDGATPSVWYYSTDGITWTTATSTSDFAVPLSNYRGEWYVYVPYSSMYIRAGKSFITTGTHNNSETGMSFLEAREAAGGWKSAARFRMGITESGMGTTAIINDVQFVYKSDKAPVIPSKENLPVVGETLANPMFKTNTYTNPTSSTGMAPTATMNFKDAEGIMIEVDTTAMTAVNPLQFTFWIAAKPSAGSSGTSNYFLATAGRAREHANSAVPDDAISIWYWSEDGVNWKAYTSDSTTRYMTLNAKKTTGYIYIPFTSFWSRYSADYINGTSASADKTKPSISYAEYMAAIGDDYTISTFGSLFWGNNTDTAGAKLTNWCYVDIDRTKADAAKAPSTLPDTGKDYATVPMFKPEYNELTGWTTADGTSFTQTSWLSNNAFSSAMIPSTLEYANGIMMKVDTSKVAMGDDEAGIAIAFQANLPNGKQTIIASTLGAATRFGLATNPEDVASTWYVSNDGQNWLAITGSEWYAYITAQRGVLHVYIPTSSMYVQDGETFLKTGVADTSEPAVSYAEANAMVGGFTKFNEVRIFTSNNAAGHELTISDVNLVGTPLRVFQSASISMTEDLAYNLYAKLPEGAENAQVEFTMSGKTVVSTGITEENGLTRYTFSNIYSQHLGEVITMTWTATVNGEPQIETYTDSLLLYLQKILKEDSYSNWHDLAKALLHYGAAAQTYTGVQGALVNDNVSATLAPVNISQLPYTLVNNAPAIWTSATLALNNSINLVVGVTAPMGITKVQYTVGDRTGTASIRNDGYVYVPVYAYELLEPVTLRLLDGSTPTEHGSCQISASAYIKEKFNNTDDANLKALLQAIANYGQEAILLKGNRTRITNATPTLTQVELERGGGMSYIIQMADGRFIVIDGGTNTQEHISRLWTYLIEKSGYANPVIATWMFTHQHSDHIGAAFALLKTNWQKMEVQGFAYSWVEKDQILISDAYDSQTPSSSDKTYAEYRADEWADAEKREKEFNEQIKPKYPNATYWDMKRGDVQTIGDVQVKILLSARDVCRDDVFELNDFSAAWKMTFANGKTFLVLGDCSSDRLEYLEEHSAADLSADILQATHHGLEGGVKSTYQLVAPTISLISTRKEVFTEDKLSSYYILYYMGTFNSYLRDNSTVYYNEDAPVINLDTLTNTPWSSRPAIDVVMTKPGALVLGNKLSSMADVSSTRAATAVNIWLNAGQGLRLKDNVTYKWGIKLNSSSTPGTNLGNYLPVSSGWTTTDTFRAVQDGWYCVVVLKASDESFDFATDPDNIYDYVTLLTDIGTDAAVNSMVQGNRNVNADDKTTSDGTTQKNLYLYAGQVIRLKDNVNYKYAIKIAQSDILGTCASDEKWLTGGWSANSLRITADGFYCIVIRYTPSNGNATAFDFAGKDLYDYIEISSLGDEPIIPMVHGNKISDPTEKSTNRAGTSINVYLQKGQQVILKDSTTYKWNIGTVSATNPSQTLSATKKDYLLGTENSSSWVTYTSYTVQTSGYYVIAFARVDGKTFVFDDVQDGDDLFDYVTIRSNVALKQGNKNTDADNTKEVYDATAEINLWLTAGTTITLKDTTNTRYAVKKAKAPELGYPATTTWLTGGWSNSALTITEDGYYCIVVRKAANGSPSTSRPFDFTTDSKYLFDYVVVK